MKTGRITDNNDVGRRRDLPKAMVAAAALLLGALGCGGDGPTDIPLMTDVRGVWQGSGTDESGPGTITLDLEQEDFQVTGSFTATDQATGLQATGSVEGVVESGEFGGFWSGSFPTLGCTFHVTFMATVQGNRMQGTYSGQGCHQPIENGSFELTRQ